MSCVDVPEETVAFANGLVARITRKPSLKWLYVLRVVVENWQGKIPVTDRFDEKGVERPTIVIHKGQEGGLAKKGYFVAPDGHLDLCMLFKLHLDDEGYELLVLVDVDSRYRAYTLQALDSVVA